MADREFTLEEIAQHKKDGDAWIVIDGLVYDVSGFLDVHPGGKQALLSHCGGDASKKFHMLHDPKVLKKYGPKFLMGTVKVSAASSAAGAAAEPPRGSFPYQPDVKGVVPSSVQSWNSGGTSEELPRERAKASFNVEKLTHFLDGGEENTKRRRFILAPLKRIDVSDKHNLDRFELMSKHFEDFIGIHKPFIAEGYIPQRDEVVWMSEAATNTGSLMPHFALFVPTILGQAAAHQVAEWLPKALNFQIVGAYAQTELGHGSNVRGLQTTATFDKEKRCFVLNTPTLQSMKWWNSGIGLAATHASVYAQLILDGKEHGVHVFMVQLRDEHHRMLPGIEAGDCGPKLGDHAIDTGYLRLKDVHIPLENLFSARQSVTSDGKYVKKEDKSKGKSDKAHYATMLQARAGMISIAGGKLGIAATIATRYSCVRRQGFPSSSATGAPTSFKDKEMQIIDYGVQQFRLFRSIATAYAIKLSGRWINDHFTGDAVREGDDVIEVHATSAGLKGLCTQLAADGIEDCRRACGGHGYLLASGLGALSLDYVWQLTAEGDYIVMLLQTARFLVKCASAAKAGEPLSGNLEYLRPLAAKGFSPSAVKAPKAPTASPARFRNLGYLVELFKARALVVVAQTAERLQSVTEKAGADSAWQRCSVQLTETARTHCYLTLLTHFVAAVNNVGDVQVKAVVKRLCELFACTQIIEGQQWAGLLSSEDISDVESTVDDILRELRPDAVPIVDAFDFLDTTLNSALGHFDGNVYEALYIAATRSRLNQEQPFRGYAKFLQPELDIEFLKRGNFPSKL